MVEGFFHFLPQSTHPKHFEMLFGTPLDLDYRMAVLRCMVASLFRLMIGIILQVLFLKDRNKSGLRVIEMVTNRDKNVKEHRDLWKFVSQEI